jgi:hypothetical protein
MLIGRIASIGFLRGTFSEPFVEEVSWHFALQSVGYMYTHLDQRFSHKFISVSILPQSSLGLLFDWFILGSVSGFQSMRLVILTPGRCSVLFQTESR